MRVAAATATTIVILAAAALLFIKISEMPAAEISRSYLASAWPQVFGWLRSFPQRPMTERLAEHNLRLGDPVLIRVFKEESILELWMADGEAFRLAASYPICAWSGALGPKLKEGDRQSPEGYYLVSERNLNPNSQYYRAINVGFPNAYDEGLHRTGSALMIHGSCVSAGCYAIRDEPMDDVYSAVTAALDAGQPSIQLHIFPFRLTEDNLTRHGSNRWIGFWRNLAEGDRLFSADHRPPAIFACGNHYAFGSGAAGCSAITPW